MRSPTLVRRAVLVSLLAQLVARLPAFAGRGQTFTGSTHNGPVWRRPNADCSALSASSVRYHVQPFYYPGAPTLCSIHTVQEFSGFLHVYEGIFDANEPLARCIRGNDVGATDGQSTIELIEFSPGASTYFLVTSGSEDGDVGPFQNAVHCRGQPLHGACETYFPAVPLEQQVCLNPLPTGSGGGFTVSVGWETNNRRGLATPVRTGSTDTALFWFFSDSNWEVMLKVLNGCPVNGHFWVFIGALTNQGYTVRVGNVETLEVRTYTNPLGTRSPAFTDTRAFPCN